MAKSEQAAANAEATPMTGVEWCLCGVLGLLAVGGVAVGLLNGRADEMLVGLVATVAALLVRINAKLRAL